MSNSVKIGFALMIAVLLVIGLSGCGPITYSDVEKQKALCTEKGMGYKLRTNHNKQVDNVACIDKNGVFWSINQMGYKYGR